jgi:diadenosine tetraphosphate (Ap4A) HIT family hydrolase
VGYEGVRRDSRRRLRHVAEPTELEVYETAAYWREVMMIGRATEAALKPAKMNYETLGNNVPHLHTHIIPRPWLGDPSPNGHLGSDFLDNPRQTEEQVRRTVQTLRPHLDPASS